MKTNWTKSLAVLVGVALTGLAFSATTPEVRKLTVQNVLTLKELGISEEDILKKITDSGTTFVAEDIEKLKQGGFGDEFIAKLPKPEAPTPEAPAPEAPAQEQKKLTVENVLVLKQLGITEDSILEKVKTSKTVFTAEDVQKLKDGGMSEEFLKKLAAPEAVAGPQETVAAPGLDLDAAREKLRPTVTELKNLVDAENAAMEQFDGSAKKLQSFREAGVVTQEGFVEGMEKAAQNHVAASDDRVAKAKELEKAVAAAPSLPEKNAATQIASQVLEYLEALRKTRELAVAVAKGEKEKKELDASRTAAGDLKTKLTASHKLYQTDVKKRTKSEWASDARTASWHVEAGGATVDFQLLVDGSYKWHYKAGDDVEDLQGAWKPVDNATIEVTEKGSRTKNRIPCKLIGRDTLEVTLQGVVFQFKRK
jgi:hypothetical protein